MNSNITLRRLPKSQKCLIVAFLFVLSIGFFTGLGFVSNTTDASIKGIKTQYIGNEGEDDDLYEMKFKKSSREMLTIIHTHTLSLALIFGCVGFLMSLTETPQWLKTLLIIEPFVSIVFTFGGLFILWIGVTWFSYVVAISGFLMTASYVLAVTLIFRDLYLKSSLID